MQPKFFEWIAHSLIYHERPERITHSRSFVMSDLSDLLTVAHLSWATWAIGSQSIICLERSEQIAHSRSFDLIEWANEQMNEFPAVWIRIQIHITNPDPLNCWIPIQFGSTTLSLTFYKSHATLCTLNANIIFLIFYFVI